jgi:IS30 family transposase
MSGNIDWQKVSTNLPADWSKEDRKLAELLAQGTSTPEIARIMGQHRSMIWRKVQRLKARMSGHA